MIDAHVHFWQLARGDYQWINNTRPALNKDFSPGDFLKASTGTEVTSCIAVQATPTEAETEYLLKLSDSHSHIAGVTGWLDLTAPDVSQNLEQLASHPKLVGIRPMTGVMKGEQWLSQSAYSPGFKALVKHDLVLEALALPHHLKAIIDIAHSFSDLRIVLNHAAKPELQNSQRWLKDIQSFARLQNTYCKVSGFTQQSSDRAHHMRVFDTLLAVFGTKRLLWGSDFPVLLETSDYNQWIQISKSLWSLLSTDEISQITSGTAQRLYRLSLAQDG